MRRLAVLTVLAVLTAGCTARPPARPAPRPTPVASRGVAGGRVIGYFGIDVTVPVGYVVGPAPCAAPSIDAVVLDTGAAASCPGQRPTVRQPRRLTYTTVELGPSLLLSTPDGVRATRGVAVDGTPAMTGTDRRDGRSVGVLVVPSRRVAVEVASPSARIVRTILRSVRLAAVDPNGCRDRAAPLTRTSNPPAEMLVPERPTQGVVCEYTSAYRLIDSEVLSRGGLVRLRWVLDRRSTSQLNDVQPTLLVARYVLRVRGGKTRVIDAQEEVEPARVTDGRRTVALAGSATFALLRQ